MNTVALYSPYIPKHFGGGERYLLSIAEVASWTHPTYLLVPHAQVKQAADALAGYTTAFGLDLSKVQVQGTTLGTGKNPIAIAKETKKYDVLFAMTDGSIFASLAKRSYFIVQIPWTRHLSLFEKVKLSTWKNVFVYSHFVEKVLRKSWGIGKISVLSPYVDTRDFAISGNQEREKVILSIGRFFAHEKSNSKRQDILIEAFKSLVDVHNIKNWTLVLVGNVESPEFLESLKKQAKGYRIVFATNISYDEVRAYCSRASLYWHAAGFSVDESKNPENTEHFGITTLEAMASGCIPLVVPLGGQSEVVADPRFFWNTAEELVEKSFQIISQLSDDKEKVKHMREKLRGQAEKFSKANFERVVMSLLD